MNPWLRRLHVILAIGGSFTGAVLTLQVCFTSKNLNALTDVMYASFVVLYAFGVVAGVRLSEKECDTLPLIIFYGLQVPWISSPVVGFRFAAGFHFSAAFIGGRLNWLFRLGSDWRFNLLQDIPWGIGVNFFALAMMILLVMTRKPPQNITIPPVLPANRTI